MKAKKAAKAPKGKKGAKAKAVAPPVAAAAAAAPGKEQALAALAAALSLMMTGCYNLHGDGRLTADQQNTFYVLGNRTLHVMTRLDPLWTRIIDSAVVSAADLVQLGTTVGAANAALLRTQQVPTVDNQSKAASLCSTAIDRVDSMLDRVA
jgi:hypothetical protein